MSRIPVVFTFDKRIIYGSAVAIKSLVESANTDTVYDIYVYHPDLSENVIKDFEKMLEGSRNTITFQFIDKKRFENAPVNKHGSWTEIVYYRLLIPELLPQYDKVIYSDTDVLFKRDLSEVYNEDILDFECSSPAMEKNGEDMICHKYFSENKNELIHSSGFMVMNCKKMRENHFVERVFETIKKYYNELRFFDLDVFNITCQNIKNLPFRYVFLQSFYYNEDIKKANEYEFVSKVYSDEEILKEKENVVIVHYAGKPGKPWRFKKVPPDYKKIMDTIPKSLRKYTFRDIRKKLFSKV